MSDLWPGGGPLLPPGQRPHDYGDDGKSINCTRCGVHFLDAEAACTGEDDDAPAG